MWNAECSRIAPGLLLNMFYAFILQISALSFIHHLNSFLPEALLMISKSILQYICKLKSWLFFSSFEFWYKKIFTFYAIQTFLYILPHAGRLRQNHLSFSLWHIAIRHMIPVTKRQCWAFDVILMKTSPIPSSTGGFRQEKLHLAVWYTLNFVNFYKYTRGRCSFSLPDCHFLLHVYCGHICALQWTKRWFNNCIKD